MGAKHGSLAERFERFVDRTGGADACHVWTGAKAVTGGYGVIRGSDGRTLKAHRVSYELHVAPIPDGAVVCHRCDNPPCVNPEHLFVGTQADNNHDMLAKGREARGDGHSKALSGRQPWRKLSDEQVAEIRRRRAAGERLSVLAREMGVSETTASQAAKGDTWRHLGSAPAAGPRPLHVCRSPHCGGDLGGPGVVEDGAFAHCSTCGRRHVFRDGGVYVDRRWNRWALREGKIATVDERRAAVGEVVQMVRGDG